MKKISLILLALTALAACSKGSYDEYYDVLGGRTNVTGSWSEGRNYMMSIADGLMAGVLDELTLAHETQARNPSSSSHFDMKGRLTTPGSIWTVSTETSLFAGMKIHCVAENVWDVTYEGDFYICDGYYPTKFSATATLAETSNWLMAISGSREERGGYHCTFETRASQGSEPRMSFANTLGAKVSGWNQIKGDLFLTVYKNKDIVDVSRLSFNGAPSQAVYTRGL